MRFPAAPLAPRARTHLLMSVAVMPAVAVAGYFVDTSTGLWLTVLAVLTVFYLVGTLPIGYSVEPGRLVVHRRGLADKRFALDGEPERFRNALAIDWRWYGTGWRPAGKQWSAKQGLPPQRVYLAVTDREAAVLVPTEEGTVIATPSVPEELVAHAREVAR